MGRSRRQSLRRGASVLSADACFLLLTALMSCRGHCQRCHITTLPGPAQHCCRGLPSAAARGRRREGRWAIGAPGRAVSSPRACPKPAHHHNAIECPGASFAWPLLCATARVILQIEGEACAQNAFCCHLQLLRWRLCAASLPNRPCAARRQAPLADPPMPPVPRAGAAPTASAECQGPGKAGARPRRVVGGLTCRRRSPPSGARRQGPCCGLPSSLAARPAAQP